MTQCSFVAIMLVPGGGLLLPTVIIKILLGPGPGHTALQRAKLARADDQPCCDVNRITFLRPSNQTPPHWPAAAINIGGVKTISGRVH